MSTVKTAVTLLEVLAAYGSVESSPRDQTVIKAIQASRRGGKVASSACWTVIGHAIETGLLEWVCRYKLDRHYAPRFLHAFGLSPAGADYLAAHQLINIQGKEHLS